MRAGKSLLSRGRLPEAWGLECRPPAIPDLIVASLVLPMREEINFPPLLFVGSLDWLVGLHVGCALFVGDLEDGEFSFWCPLKTTNTGGRGAGFLARQHFYSDKRSN